VPVCQCLTADPIDARVVQAFFEAVAPAELEVWERSQAAQRQAEEAMARSEAQQIERLRYQAGLAERQFDKVDPDNRNVAAELERRWEAALRELHQAEEGFAQRQASRVRPLEISADVRSAFLATGRRLPALWQDPALDYTLERPVGALAKKQWQDTRAAERDVAMARLSERYGLFYFFAQTCGACEVMSPIVKAVASRWRITVRAISTDGGPSPHFPDYSVEKGQRPRMGLEPGITPAVVLWDSVGKRPIPIGYGVLSADELQDRIYLLTSKEAGHDY